MFPGAFREGDDEGHGFGRVGEAADQWQVRPPEVVHEEDARRVSGSEVGERQQRPADGGSDGAGDAVLPGAGEPGEDDDPRCEVATFPKEG